MPSQVQLNDVGIIVEVQLVEIDELTNLETALDLTGATLTEIDFRKPQAASIDTKTATIFGSPTQGILRYSTEIGFVDTVGVWKFQAHVAFGSARDFRSAVGRFEVFANL